MFKLTGRKVPTLSVHCPLRFNYYVVFPENILYRLDESVRFDNKIELVKALPNELDEINRNLLSTEEIRSQTAAQIVVFLSHTDPSILVRSVSFLFQNAQNVSQLSLFVKILTSELVNKVSWPYAEKRGYFSVILEQVFSRNVTTSAQMWSNLLTLLK